MADGSFFWGGVALGLRGASAADTFGNEPPRNVPRAWVLMRSVFLFDDVRRSGATWNTPTNLTQPAHIGNTLNKHLRNNQITFVCCVTIYHRVVRSLIIAFGMTDIQSTPRPQQGQPAPAGLVGGNFETLLAGN